MCLRPEGTFTFSLCQPKDNFNFQSMGMFMAWTRILTYVFVIFPHVIALDLDIIDSINELSETQFGKSFPRHGLLLLYWFASLIDIDRAGTIQFKEGSYDKVTDFPFRQEVNSDHFPFMMSTGQGAYYSAGDLNDYSACFMPPYVTQDFYNSNGFKGQNQDRLVLVIDKWYTPAKIDQVFIAEDSGYNLTNLTSVDVKTAYRVGLQLLRQISTLHRPLGCQSSFLKEIFPHLGFNLTLAENMYSPVGLPLFVALAGYDLEDRYNFTAFTWSCPSPLPKRKCLCNTSWQELVIRTSQYGHAIVSWHGLPGSILQAHTTVALFQADTPSSPLMEQRIDGQASGSIETSVPMHPGLQVRLIKRDISDNTIWKGPILSDGTRQLPIKVGNFTASMRLFTRRGFAGIRLYLHKSFTTWEDDFYYSWVGFYVNAEDDNDSYLSHQWQWVTRFTKHKLLSVLWNDVYEYVSGTAITPGIQARFFLSENNLVACTKPWDM